MPTFLVNARMNPALAARVEASVTGRKSAARPSARVVRRIVAVARVVLVAAFAFAIYTGVTTMRRSRREVEQTRAALLASIEAERATVTAKELTAVDRVGAWTTLLSGPYEGDLREHGVKDALRRPAVYVRGPIDSLRTREQLTTTAAVSGKDALLVCLVDPPSARTEAAMVDKVHVVLAGGAPLEERTPNIRRLNDAIIGLPLLSPDWAEHVRAADDIAELSRLRKELDRVPLERTKRALRAEILVVVLDEKGDGSGPTELDGERPHDVRVAIIDLEAGKPLFRAKKHVDPSWISNARRPTQASGLDSCALGYDLSRSL